MYKGAATMYTGATGFTRAEGCGPAVYVASAVISRPQPSHMPEGSVMKGETGDLLDQLSVFTAGTLLKAHNTSFWHVHAGCNHLRLQRNANNQVFRAACHREQLGSWAYL